MEIKQPAIINRPGKQSRERKVLLGLIDHYVKSGKPVGSNTLKEAGFEDLSSATIRNYFANLEEEGFLKQEHLSGGRIPTDKAFKLYAHEYEDSYHVEDWVREELMPLHSQETREIVLYLQQAAERLSALTQTAVFLSAPRFDQDFITNVKLVALDADRALCILVTDFGVVRTEVLHLDKKFNSFSLKRIESYFHFRLTSQDKPENLEKEEEALAQLLYNEVVVRYIVGYSNFTDAEIHRTGFSKLLAYPDFNDVSVLAGSLSLFENVHSMRLLLKECTKQNRLRFWIGDDLGSNCSVIAVPYYINQTVVGAVGLLGPTRLFYRQLFGTLRLFSECISSTLTKSLYKHKLSFRQVQLPEIEDKRS